RQCARADGLADWWRARSAADVFVSVRQPEVVDPGIDDYRGGGGHLGIPGNADRAVHPHPLRVPRALGRWRFAGGQPVARHEGPRAPGALGRRDARAVGAAAAVPAMMGAHARPHAAAGEAAGGPARGVAIAGSLRRESLNPRLIEAAAGCAPEGIAVGVRRWPGAPAPLNHAL